MPRIVICGGGTAGCVLAARLSEDPHVSVVLLEAGPDYPVPEEAPADIRDSWNFGGTEHDWGFVADDVVPGDDSSPFADAAPREGAIYAYRGKVMGGSSAVNAAGAYRPPREDFARWAALGNDWWSWEQVLPVYRSLEDDPIGGDLHGTGGPVPIRRVARGDMRPLHADFFTAAERLGYRVVQDGNAGVSGVHAFATNAVDRLRYSASVAFLRPARSRTNLEIRADVLVDRVELDGDRAYGVRLATGELVEGDLVILAAGALGSPAILMRSGIGPADVLAQAGIEQAHSAEAVGRNLRDHPTVFVTYELLDPRDAAGTPIEATLTIPSRAPSETEPAVIVLPVTPAAEYQASTPVVAVLVGLLRPYSLGRFEIRSPDPHEAPRITFNFFDHPDDLARTLVGVKLARELAATAPFAHRVGAERWPGPETQSDRALAQAVLAGQASFAHATSTCAMGPAGTPWSVVDQRGRVHGLESLYVIDASIFPDIPTAAPNLTVMMLAERCATSLREQFSAVEPNYVRA